MTEENHKLFRRRRKSSAPGRLGVTPGYLPSGVMPSPTSMPPSILPSPKRPQSLMPSPNLYVNEEISSFFPYTPRKQSGREGRQFNNTTIQEHPNHNRLIYMNNDPVGDSAMDEDSDIFGSIVPLCQHPTSKMAEQLPENPGEIALILLMKEFVESAQHKIEMYTSQERPLSKSLQRGEDPQFDQLLSSLSSVAEHCLSSLLKTLFLWYEKQKYHNLDDNAQRSPSNRSKSGVPESPKPSRVSSFHENVMEMLLERRDMAVEFIFCLVLIEVLKQLSLHPVEDKIIKYIEDLAFKHFKECRPSIPQAANQNIINALYAEVIGVLAQTRFQSIRIRYMQEYKENIGNTQILLNITMGLKYIRIKLYPVDEVEEAFLFLQDCATLFLEKNLDKEVKYAFASLFVEILIPVAAVAKREYSIPTVKKFVDMLFKEVFDMSRKAKHSMAFYPLVTALLCISQDQFFLTNWGGFLNMCLNSIKSKDSKMQRMAMECLYRLLWVYIIRIHCEGHTITINKLRSIVDTLFPKNSRTIIPRNIPLTIFVKIIQFIAQEKLDFAMEDIIFDLLNIGRSVKQLNPERMNIGLRAFLVIADNLQRKEGSPPMPSTIGQLPSGNTLKVKKTFTKLTEEAAKNIGVVTYYTSVRRALGAILKTLDAQVGRAMTLMNPQNVNKEANDMITGERKSKIELFRTCVAAIPKCIPDGISKVELVELMARLTLHIDEELRSLAFAALQGLVVDFPEYRQDIIDGFIDFTLKEVQDAFPQLTDNAIRMLAQLLIQWRSVIIRPIDSLTDKYLEMSMHCSKTAQDYEKHAAHTIHNAEGFAMAMLCSIKAGHRKLALTVLRELRSLSKVLYNNNNNSKYESAIDIIEKNAPSVIEKALVYVSGSDKSSLGLSPQMDLHLLAEKSALLAEKQKDNVSNCISRDLWSHCLAGFLELIISNSKQCPCTFQFTWPYVNNRLFTIYSVMDPNSDFDSIKSRSSIISFKAPRIQVNLSDVCLWRNYLIFLCCATPEVVLSQYNVEGDTIKMEKLPPDYPRLSDVLRTVIMMVRCESYEIREAAVAGLGKTGPLAHPVLIEELQPLMREILDKKAEGVRKRRKRDLLRLQVARIFAANAEQGCFRHSLALQDNNIILQCLSEYIEGMRAILESENEKEDASFTQLRLQFSNFLHRMIKSVPFTMQSSLLRNQGRHHLFLLLASWCGHFNVTNLDACASGHSQSPELELSALEGMCALLCCGRMFDQKSLYVGDGYLYKLLDAMLLSNIAKINKLGQETVELLLENNEHSPVLLSFVIDRCYTGERRVSNGFFLALANVFSKHAYQCQLIPLLCVVLFKTGDPSQDIREKAVQLIYILDRRFFWYMIPFRYTYGSQAFSMQLAHTHPELTLPIMSEIMLRFESATMVGQRCLLHYLVPWLRNIELVDVSLDDTVEETYDTDLDEYEVLDCSCQLKPVSMQGEGWGSTRGSHMVLNNLLYLTVKYEEVYNKEIEECWTALCDRWESNVPRIIDYLIIMAGLCGTAALMHAKKVAIYITRAQTEETISCLTEELKITDVVTNSWDRLDSSPYLKRANKCDTFIVRKHSPITPLREESVESDTNPTDESPKIKRGHLRNRHEGSLCGSDKSFVEASIDNGKANISIQSVSSESWMFYWVTKAQLQVTGVGLPLPIPYRLQYFAQITQLFPLTTPPAQLCRCNFALMLLAEIISDRRDISWMKNLPLLLHVSFLGLDHPKPLVHENCKRMIINLLVTLVCDGDRSTIAKALMDFQTVSSTAMNQSTRIRSSNVNNSDTLNSEDSNKTEELESSYQADMESPELEERGLSIDERAREVIEYLAKSDCKPLWALEDITPRNATIKSSDQLELFLQIIVSLFSEALPRDRLLGEWAREALRWATLCSSRHYAGRSFQVFRALKVPLSWPMLSDILQRLIDSVADSSDDVQGYFMEIIFTLLAEVDSAFNKRTQYTLQGLKGDALKRTYSLQDFGSIPDEAKKKRNSLFIDALSRNNKHSRSSSIDFNVENIHTLHATNSHGKREDRRYASDMTSLASQVNAASFQTSRELYDLQLPDSPYDMATRLFWIGVSLLESDYEHEFLFAIRLIEKVLEALDLKSAQGIDRVEGVLKKLKWNTFPGVQSLLLKGLTSSGTAEQTLRLLSKLTALTSISVIDPSPSSGLSLNVVALLPRLIIGFEDPDDFCKTTASNIQMECGSNAKLNDLGVIMQMYRDREYSKSVQVWIEVVCKNMIDAFPQLSYHLLALLVEVLEQGPPLFQQPVLNIICAILKYSDASTPGLKQFHGYLLRVITSHVKDANLWMDSLSILKLVVSNSSQIQHVNPSVGIMSAQLVQPRGSIGSLLTLAPKLPWGNHLTLGENSWSLTSQIMKNELPGRTIEFTYNIANTPLIGAKYSNVEKVEHSGSSLNSHLGVSQAPCWRKPHASQKRTRERLVQLLPLCGHKGGLKQSQVVIFSSTSETSSIESDKNSTDEVFSDHIEDEFSGQKLNKLFTHFDFLDDELDRGSEGGNFCWTSTSEVNDEFPEGDHISLRESESDNILSAKDDEISADDEETGCIEHSLPDPPVITSGEEEDDDEEEEEDEAVRGKEVGSLSRSAGVSQKRIPGRCFATPNGSLSSTNDEASTPEMETKSLPATVNILNGNMDAPSRKSSTIVTVEMSRHTTTSSSNNSTSVSHIRGHCEEKSLVTVEHPILTDYVVLSYDEIPDRWSRLMSSFVGQPTLDEAVDSFPCLPLVLKSWSIWLARLSGEATQLLNRPALSKICSQLTIIGAALEHELHLPYIFIGEDVLTTGTLLAKHRLTVLKLNVGLQGLHEQREQARDQMDLLQATKNEFSSDDQPHGLFHGGIEKSNYDERGIIDLCACLYRIHMQYVMCLELYLNYVERIIRTVHTAKKVTDVTADLVNIKSELTTLLSSSNTGEELAGPITNFKETADLVSNAVATGHFHNAIVGLRSYRQRHAAASQHETGGDEEIETILSIYARSILKSRSSVFALLGSSDQLSYTCDNISEHLADLLSTIYECRNRMTSESDV